MCTSCIFFSLNDSQNPLQTSSFILDTLPTYREARPSNMLMSNPHKTIIQKELTVPRYSPKVYSIFRKNPYNSITEVGVYVIIKTVINHNVTTVRSRCRQCSLTNSLQDEIWGLSGLDNFISLPKMTDRENMWVIYYLMASIFKELVDCRTNQENWNQKARLL